MASFELSENYDVARGQIDDMEEAERKEFEKDMLSKGVAMCPFDDCGCNMALVSESGKVMCCGLYSRRGSENMFFCGRIRFKGGQGYNLSIFERFEHKDFLECSEVKLPDAPCLFDKGVCLSESHKALCGNPASPCIVSMVDKVGFGSVWFCGRIQFSCSRTSIAQKVRSQGLLGDGKV